MFSNHYFLVVSTPNGEIKFLEKYLRVEIARTITQSDEVSSFLRNLHDFDYSVALFAFDNKSLVYKMSPGIKHLDGINDQILKHFSSCEEVILKNSPKDPYQAWKKPHYRASEPCAAPPIENVSRHMWKQSSDKESVLNSKQSGAKTRPEEQTKKEPSSNNKYSCFHFFKGLFGKQSLSDSKSKNTCSIKESSNKPCK